MTEPKVALVNTAAKREWLVGCTDNNLGSAVCSVGVCRGDVEIYAPGGDLISLSGHDIADFHTALHAAIAQADADLRILELERKHVDV